MVDRELSLFLGGFDDFFPFAARARGFSGEALRREIKKRNQEKKNRNDAFHLSVYLAESRCPHLFPPPRCAGEDEGGGKTQLRSGGRLHEIFDIRNNVFEPEKLNGIPR